jgi:hypothetical protein
MHQKGGTIQAGFFVKTAFSGLTFGFYAHFWRRSGYCVCKALGLDSFFARQ